MTYESFHWRFNAPLLLLLAGAASFTWTWTDTAVTAGVVLLAVAFTTPWDNWAVARGIWDFPDNRIRFRIGKCPVEEYAFFVIQTVQACLLMHVTIWKLHGHPIPMKLPPDWTAAAWTLAASIPAGWVILRLPLPPRLAYLRHLLVWMLPVIALQWCAGGVWIGMPVPVLAVTFGLGFILCAFDTAAIAAGVWFFDDSQTLGIRLFGILPLEEALFFHLTTLLAAQSYLLLLP